MTTTPPAKPAAWKVLSETIEFETPYIRARRQSCETARGAIIDPYHVFDMPSWAAMLAVTPDMQAILINNYRHGAERIMVELPGGLVDDTDSDTANAATRELLEETGHSVEQVFNLPPIHPYPGRFRQHAYPFVGIGAKRVQAQALEDDEDLEVFTVPLSEAFRMFADGSVDVAAVHSGIMLAARHLIMTNPALVDLRQAL